MNILAALRQTTKGLHVIDDWLGCGGAPVPREQAESRSQKCLDCPNNKAPKWWESAKGSIAQAIRDMLSIKNECALELKNEERLHMCSKCGCCLTLKCWTPIAHVRKVVDQKTVLELPSFCWIRTEIIGE